MGAICVANVKPLWPGRKTGKEAKNRSVAVGGLFWPYQFPGFSFPPFSGTNTEIEPTARPLLPVRYVFYECSQIEKVINFHLPTVAPNVAAYSRSRLMLSVCEQIPVAVKK